MAKETKPFGLWSSPVSPAALALRLRLEDVQWDSDGETLVWLEGRSDRGVLVAQSGGEASRDLTEEISVRGGVGYGGGEFCVRDGVVVFAGADGRLYRRALEPDIPKPITAEYGSAASPAISADGRWVAYVHSYEHKDVIALVDSCGAGWAMQLARGSDFVMQPAWHPQGKYLAWVEWDHPNMPWDGARLVLAKLAGEIPSVVERQIVAGGSDVPVFQPVFSADGRYLAYLAGDGEWDALWLRDLQTHTVRKLVDGAALLPPAWVQGMRTIAWRADSRAIYYLRNDAGFASLWMVELEDSDPVRLETAPYTWISQVSAAPSGDRIAFIASAPQVPARIVSVARGRTFIHRRSGAEDLQPGDLSSPEPLEWQGVEGMTVHGLYYPPLNARYTADGAPPAIIYIHGGPTSQVTAAFNADAAFFTSRGYAYLAVNYRGSTGYGRSYMRALDQRWGVLDVEDAVSGGQALVNRSLADIKKLVIKGGSAGGYTVLNSLIRFPRFFKAGLCSFGVSNLFTLARDTHKFEERYLDTMVGPLPQTADRYHAWSPIYHAEHIRAALAVFQGDSDKVVPPDQSEQIVMALRANRVPHIYRLYPGEGHGWRKSETIAAFYRDVDQFLQEQVIFSA